MLRSFKVFTQKRQEPWNQKAPVFGFCDWRFLNKNGDLRPRSLVLKWLRGLDLNQRPLGYEPNELPDCSTPRH